MNLDIAAAVAKAFLADLQVTGAVKRLQRLSEALNNVINSANADTQNALAQTRNELRDAIGKSNFHEIPKTWASSVDAMSIRQVTGANLLNSVDSIFRENQITPSEALKKVTELKAILEQIRDQSLKLSEAATFFSGAAPKLPPADGVLSVLIPRSAIDNDLAHLAHDLKNINKDVLLVAEIAEGSRSPVEVREISTTDPVFWLAASAPTVLLLLEIVDRIQSAIEKTYIIRQARAAAIQAEMGAKIMVMYEETIRSRLDSDFVAIQEWAVAKAKADSSRKAELLVEAKKVIQDLAARLDNGYQFEGEVPSQPEPVKDAAPEIREQWERRELLRTEVAAVAERIHYRELPGEPVLGLPFPNSSRTSDDQSNGVV